ncbi:hypothetical protein RJ641_024473 [Dillenia turbinata]|uniref:DUF7356 domain-containing protein n=1 Tax=Dillenia turbinata TaxID=194707 RepID=A0AAN8W7M9_9MAGN
MDRGVRFVTLMLLFFLIVCDCTNASLFPNFRLLIDADPNATTNQKGSPQPTSASEAKKSDSVPTNTDKSGDKSSTGDQSEGEPEKPKVTPSPPPPPSPSPSPPPHSPPPPPPPRPPPPPPVGKKEPGGGKKSNDQKPGKQEGTSDKAISPRATETCDGLRHCTVDKMVACIRRFEYESKEAILLVQNEGDSTLNVKVTVTSSNAEKKLDVPKHQSKNISIPVSVSEGVKIVLNAGKEDCELDASPISGQDYLQQFLSYAKLVNPIYGVYFLILTAVIVGGACACCKVRKRRQGDGVPYQELEMGLPESIPTVNVDTAEGWDQVWDDDWDEENAVKSPGARYAGSVSANGLAARSSNRDGWEKDWNN